MQTNWSSEIDEDYVGQSNLALNTFRSESIFANFPRKYISSSWYIIEYNLILYSKLNDLIKKKEDYWWDNRTK